MDYIRATHIHTADTGQILRNAMHQYQYHCNFREASVIHNHRIVNVADDVLHQMMLPCSDSHV